MSHATFFSRSNCRQRNVKILHSGKVQKMRVETNGLILSLVLQKASWVHTENWNKASFSVAHHCSGASLGVGASTARQALYSERPQQFSSLTDLSVNARATFLVRQIRGKRVNKKGWKMKNVYRGAIILPIGPQNSAKRWTTFLAARGRWRHMSAVAGASLVHAPRLDANSLPDAARPSPKSVNVKTG